MSVVPATAEPRDTGVLARIGAYIQLTKPRIILLLLVTTVPAMILADRGIPSLALIGATLLGGTVAAGGANALNQYLERDSDQLMARTRRRPLPTHRVRPGAALAFGISLGVVAFAWLALEVNLLAAVLTLSGLLFYVFVYTLWLKRATPQNIVIGGAAGAVPALVGWAAVTGRVAWPPVVLFAIVFLWTPPHFWALAMRYREQYAAAGIPMLPVVATERTVTRQMLAYTIVLVATSLLLIPVGRMGVIYGVSAGALGAWFTYDGIRVLRRGAPAAMTLFHHSIWYLALLFAAVAVDTVARFGV